MSLVSIHGIKKHLKKVAHPAVKRFKPAHDIPDRPLSTRWGSDRGTPIDRHFIDQFLQSHHKDIRGSVLEIKNPRYTNSIGNDVLVSEVLDINPDNKDATIIADLQKADNVQDNTFDCFILTETLQFIYDLKSAIEHARRILKPGGILLVTVPAISPLDPDFPDHDFWRFTQNSCRVLFGDVFGEDNIAVETYGNFVTCSGFLSGMAAEEIAPRRLNDKSDIYVQGVCVRAVKSPILG